jgi:hypothetical protein
VPDSSEWKLRRLENRRFYHHLLFFSILGCEITICVVVFIGGINFVLNLNSAAAIVTGLLGIAFITDIDNKGEITMKVYFMHLYSF